MNSEQENPDENLNSPSTSHHVEGNETFDDNNSVVSSASSVQISMLENKLESELAKMGKIMQDTVSYLTEHMNQKLTELDSKFNNLVADIHPNSQNSNVNSSVAQTTQSTSNTGPPAIACSSQSKKDCTSFKLKPQNFSGATDFDEFLSQFEITCEINGWQYREKSLYLANCLTGDARSLLSELDHDGRRDFNILVEKLKNRFGSVNRSEIFRTQLKSRVRNKGETIPELAQSIKKLVRQAYPGVNKDVIETLSLDVFIDALTDSDIRLRVRELGPKTLAEVEKIALRLESHKIADKQRTRLVGQLDTGCNEVRLNQSDSNPQLEALHDKISSLSNQVQSLTKQSNQNSSNVCYANDKRPDFSRRNTQNFNNNRYNRHSQNNFPNHNGGEPRRPGGPGPFNGHNPRQPNNPNSYHSRNTQYNPVNTGRYDSRSGQNQSYPTHENNRLNQENWHRSGWRATSRQ